MKYNKWSVVIALVGIALLSTACFRTHEPGRITEKAKSMYDAWDEGMAEILGKHADIAFNFNAWYNAEGAEKQRLEDVYFPYMKIREINTNEWTLSEGTEVVYRVFPDGNRLSDEGASWRIRKESGRLSYYWDYYDSHYDLITFRNQIVDIHIRCTASGEWTITIDSSPSYLNLSVKAIQGREIESLRNGNVEISGAGDLLFSRYHYDPEVALLSFTVPENMEAGMNYAWRGKFNWEKGKLDLTATDRQTGETTLANAAITNLQNGYGVTISYGGVNEIWNIYD